MLTDDNVGTLLLGGELPIRRLGYGTLYITEQRGFGRPIANATELLREAVRLGINFFDTADSYGPGHAEHALHDALHPYAKGVVIATKGGFRHDSLDDWAHDCRPEHLTCACEASLRRLDVERIDLYQLHACDPDVDYAESIGALQELQRAGKIAHIGVSNVSVERLEMALSIVDVVSVQNPYNVAYRQDDAVLDFCRARSIPFIPWMPLGDGPLERFDATRPPIVEAIAAKHGCSSIQVLLAGLLQRADVMLPIPGTSSIEHLRENVAAADLALDDDDMQRLWPST